MAEPSQRQTEREQKTLLFSSKLGKGDFTTAVEKYNSTHTTKVNISLEDADLSTLGTKGSSLTKGQYLLVNENGTLKVYQTPLNQIVPVILRKPTAADIAPDLRLRLPPTQMKAEVGGSLLNTGFTNPTVWVDNNGNPYVSVQRDGGTTYSKEHGTGRTTEYLYIGGGTTLGAGGIRTIRYVTTFDDGTQNITSISASNAPTTAGQQSLLSQLGLEQFHTSPKGIGYRIVVNATPTGAAGFAEAFIHVLNEWQCGIGYQFTGVKTSTNSFYFTFGRKLGNLDFSILAGPKFIQPRILYNPSPGNDQIEGGYISTNTQGTFQGGISIKVDDHTRLVLNTSGLTSGPNPTSTTSADLIIGDSSSYFTVHLVGSSGKGNLNQFGLSWTRNPKDKGDRLMSTLSVLEFNNQLSYFIRLGYQLSPQGLAIETALQKSGTAKANFLFGLSAEPVKGVRVAALYNTFNRQLQWQVISAPTSGQQNATVQMVVINGKPQTALGYQQRSKDGKTTTSIYFLTGGTQPSILVQYTRDFGNGTYVTGQFVPTAQQMQIIFGKTATPKGPWGQFSINEQKGVMGYLVRVNETIAGIKGSQSGIFLSAELGSDPTIVGGKGGVSFRVGLGGELFPGTQVIAYYDLRSGIQFSINTTNMPKDANGGVSATVTYLNNQVYFGITKKINDNLSATAYFNTSGQGGLMSFTYRQPNGSKATIFYNLKDQVNVQYTQYIGGNKNLIFNVDAMLSSKSDAFLASIAAKVSDGLYFGVAGGSSALAGGRGGTNNFYAFIRADIAKNVPLYIYVDPVHGTWSVNTNYLFQNSNVGAGGNTWIGIGGSPGGTTAMVGIRAGDFVLGGGSGGLNVQYRDLVYFTFDPISGKIANASISSPPIFGPFGAAAIIPGPMVGLTVGRIPVVAYNFLTHKLIVPGGIPTVIATLLLNLFVFGPMERRERQRLEFLAQQQKAVVYYNVSTDYSRDLKFLFTIDSQAARMIKTGDKLKGKVGRRNIEIEIASIDGNKITGKDGKTYWLVQEGTKLNLYASRGAKESFSVDNVNVSVPTNDQIATFIRQLASCNLTIGKAENGQMRVEVSSPDNKLERVFLLSPTDAQSVLSIILGDKAPSISETLKDKTADSMTLVIGRTASGETGALLTAVERFSSNDEVERAFRQENEDAHRHNGQTSFTVSYTRGGNRLVTLRDGSLFSSEPSEAAFAAALQQYNSKNTQKIQLTLTADDLSSLQAEGSQIPKEGYIIRREGSKLNIYAPPREFIMSREQAQNFFAGFFKISELDSVLRDPNTDTVEAGYDLRGRGFIWGRSKFLSQEKGGKWIINRTQLPQDRQSEMNALEQAIRSIGRKGTISIVHGDNGRLTVTVSDPDRPNSSQQFFGLTDSEVNKVLIKMFETHIFRNFRNQQLKLPKGQRNPLIISFVQKDKGELAEWIEPPKSVSYTAKTSKNIIDIEVLS